MSLKDIFKKIVNQTIPTNEATTKQSIIIPILKEVGFNVENPDEVILEYNIVSPNKRDKVDFLLNADGNAILLECKNVSEKLNKHIPQVIRYMEVEKKLTILTNGYDWWFFDKEEFPFWTFNIKSHTIEEYDVFKVLKYYLSRPILFKEEVSYLMRLKIKEMCETLMKSDNFIKNLDFPVKFDDIVISLRLL